MRKQKLLIFGVVSVLVAAGFLVSGLLNRGPTEVFGLETCEELGGYICEVGEECEGEWLDASDTFRCCSCNCTASEEEPLTIEPFEPTPENEELGDPY